MGHSADVTLVLLGRRGSGKSCCGNTILGTNVFKTLLSTTPVTTECKKETSVIQGRQVTVIDTPDFYDDVNPDHKFHLDTCRYWTAEGPCVFLLVLQLGRFTEGEKMVIKQTEEAFDPDVTQRMIILFSYGDDLEDITIEDFLKNAQTDLRSLVNKCGNRYHVFNNRESSKEQVNEFLHKVDNMMNCSGTHCSTWALQVTVHEPTKNDKMRKTAVEGINDSKNKNTENDNLVKREIDTSSDRMKTGCDKSKTLIDCMLEKINKAGKSKLEKMRKDEEDIQYNLTLENPISKEDATWQHSYCTPGKKLNPNSIRRNQEVHGNEKILQALRRSLMRSEKGCTNHEGQYSAPTHTPLHSRTSWFK